MKPLDLTEEGDPSDCFKCGGDAFNCHHMVEYWEERRKKEDMKLPQDYRKLSRVERAILRTQYIKKQEGKCFYCEGELDKEPPKSVTDKNIDWSLFPNYFLKHPIHLQHSHDTGMTEGAVHAYCNAVMWQYENR